MTVPVEIDEDVRVELAHAALTVCSADLRVLHIKGPVAREHFPGLPLSRRSGDADVLVGPDDAAALLVALAAAGWVRPGNGAGDHAVVLWHPVWQVTADVHLRFPGIRADPLVAFDHLWSRRRTIRLAAVESSCPSREDHAVLLLLHAARGGGDDRARADVLAVTTALGSGGLDRLGTVAAVLQADDALAAVLPDRFAPSSVSGHVHWQLRARGEGAVPLWLSRMAAARSLRARVRVLAKALFPGRAALSQGYGRVLAPAELVVAWLRRLRRGAGALREGGRRYARARRRAVVTGRRPPGHAAAQPHTVTADPAPRREPEHAEVARTDALFVARLPAGPILRLGPEAREIWHRWQSGEDETTIAAGLAPAAGLEKDLVVPGVRDFVDQLRGRGFCDPPSR